MVDGYPAETGELLGEIKFKVYETPNGRCMVVSEETWEPAYDNKIDTLSGEDHELYLEMIADAQRNVGVVAAFVRKHVKG